MLQIHNEPVDQLHPDPQNPRKSFDERELHLLGDDMLARGVLVPLLATPARIIIDGERRWRAAKLKGIAELPVIITDAPDREIRGIQLATAFHKADLRFYEKWLACAELMSANPTWQMRDLAAFLNIDASSVCRLLSPSKLNAEWLDALKADKVNMSDCYAASKLPESEQSALLALKLAGASRDDLERVSRQKRKGTAPAVKTAKVKIALPNRVSVVLTGADLGMAEVVAVLAESLKEAKKAADQYDVKTWMSMMRDRSRS